MTNNEAAKWIQLYIDLAKIDPTTGEAAYLNDDDRKTIEAMEMAINALTAQLSFSCAHENDCISRQAAIDVTDAVWSVTGDKNVAKVWDQIKDLPSAQPEQRWIPCSERLPEKDGRYQVTRYDYVANTEFIDILWYEENLWWNRHSTGDYAVTAWMPLPEPYKERREE